MSCCPLVFLRCFTTAADTYILPHAATSPLLPIGKKTACHRASRRSIEVKKPSGDPGRAHEPLHVLVSSTGKITARQPCATFAARICCLAR
uniref:Uncharacterized protein n=1 Tax=Oryza sativa subsp. japonica TaxID=39947 RepID=Q5Z7E9_ORYSJ|nr:hypothetical protein [Oryza sativa Japonica Group]